MKKMNKKDFVYIWLLILSFLLLVFIAANTTYLYGSQLDWYSQHISIPEYFRTLFYSTKDLFPDFAMNIGNGQNIYNFSYYGLYSPIVLISYLFPSVSMTRYMIVATILTVEISAILLYTFLRKNKKSETALISTFIFLTSAAIGIHSHRHIMFINYFPFLILGLFGVDKRLEKNKGWLLTISCALMIFTSYYFSIGGIFVLTIYGIYKYLSQVNKVTVKNFFKTGIHFLTPILLGILISSILTIPTLATMFQNRAASNSTIGLKDILLPKINASYLLYDSYGLGISCIAFFGLIHLFLKNKKEKIFLGILLSLPIIFPIFNFILNGTMYIDSKTLIPFLPLYIIAISEWLEDFIDQKCKILIEVLIFIVIVVLTYFSKFNQFDILLLDTGIVLISIILYNFLNRKIIIFLPIIVVSFLLAYNTTKNDTLELKHTIEENESLLKENINLVTDNDAQFYRIANDYAITNTPNKIYENSKYYTSTVYSSVANQTYNDFYFDIANNNIPARNRALTVTTGNLLFHMFSGNKYIISQNVPLQGYELVKTNTGMNIYKNEDVMPLCFATSNVMSYEDFDALANQVKQEALLKNIIADTTSKNDFVSSTIKKELDWDSILKHENITKEDNGSYSIKTKENLKITYELPKEYQNKILFIHFNMNKVSTCSEGDLLIKINNVKNKLTCKEWKYYNHNEVFDYVLAEQDLNTLTISFTKGEYNISDFETYILDYASIETINNNINPLEIDTNKTKGDYIIGNINVTEDGYLIATIPYDKGFIITIDGEQKEYELVDESFIGLPITKGNHNIKIEYKAPLKNIALLLSILGIIAFVFVTILESRRKI